MPITSGVSAKPERGDETRDLILTTAERLFAERGIAAVSNRQISEAAGQANHFAVGYHFGTKTELVLAIVRRHAALTAQRHAELLATAVGSSDLRDWVSCLVRPQTDYLAALGNPTWYARFSVQVTTDPVLRRLVIDDTIAAPAVRQTIDGIARLRPPLPDHVLQDRIDMCRHLIANVCAERERALHEGTHTPHATWDGAAHGLIDAIVGLWLAPVTPAN